MTEKKLGLLEHSILRACRFPIASMVEGVGGGGAGGSEELGGGGAPTETKKSLAATAAEMLEAPTLSAAAAVATGGADPAKAAVGLALFGSRITNLTPPGVTTLVGRMLTHTQLMTANCPCNQADTRE
jgi:hypothetical protein